MKKSVKMMCAVVALAVALFLLTGCNKQVFDVTYNYNKAMVKMPDGSVVSGKCDSWKDYEDGDQIQVVIDGTPYLTHATNVVLIKE